jgi:hypothetical protein
MSTAREEGKGKGGREGEGRKGGKGREGRGREGARFDRD